MASAGKQILPCECGKPLKFFAKTGRLSKRCSAACRGAQPWKTEAVCPGCGESFVAVKPDHKYCCSACRYKRKFQPKELKNINCFCCGTEFKQRATSSMFCSKSCKQRAYETRAGKRLPPEAAQELRLAKIHLAARQAEEKAKAIAARSLASSLRKLVRMKERQRKAELRKASQLAAAPQIKDRQQASKRAYRSARKAKLRAVTVEKFDPIDVLERDGWHCQICGVSTPRSLRGSFRPNAPELDHIVALARGGEHSMANTQCACRSCNGIKSDGPPTGQIGLFTGLGAQRSQMFTT